MLRPKLSDNPDELEQKEAYWRKQRQQLYLGEDPLKYVIRLLYEDCFSVNQQVGSMNPSSFHGSFGLTTGGLLSHYLSPGASSFLDIFTLTEMYGDAETLAEAIQILERENVAPSTMNQFFNAVDAHTKGSNTALIPTRSHLPHNSFLEVIEQAMDGKQGYEEIVDTIVSRMVGLIRELHLQQPLQQDPLVDDWQDQSKAEVIYSAWHAAQVVINRETGTFKSIFDPGVLGTVELLLKIRTHPELQFFFEYYSPSGHLNATKTKKGVSSSDEDETPLDTSSDE